MNYADLLQNSLLADQYSGMIQSNTAPNPQQYLWDYIGNALNLPKENVAPTVPATGGEQIPSTGAYVVPQPVPNTGMDTESGQRNVDLNIYDESKLEPGQVIQDGRIVGADAPADAAWWQGGPFLNRKKAGLIDFITFGLTDLDKQGNLFGGQHGASGYGGPAPQKSQAQLNKEAAIEEQNTKREVYEAGKVQRDAERYENAKFRQQAQEQEMANRYRQAQQYYDLVQKGAWDGTFRNLYGDKYSETKLQNRYAKAALAEAAMYGAVAQQASAGIVPRSRYQGKNIAIG